MNEKIKQTLKEIKKIAKDIDSTNTCEVNTYLCQIIDLCNEVVNYS